MSTEWRQIDENDRAVLVLVHEPCVANFMGSLHPDGSLYARPFNIGRARHQHDEFRNAIESFGDCKTISIRQILESAAHGNRAALEQLAASALEYACDTDSISSADVQDLLSDDYKRECLAKMSAEQLVDVILTRPRVVLARRSEVKATATEVLRNEFRPLSNLVFTRDILVVTAAGTILTRPAIPTREPETQVVDFCLQQLRIPLVGRIEAPGTLEGGDLLPAGDVCFVGVGLRTNFAAVQQVMRSDWFGCDRVAVVKDQIDCSQERMHLDTFFNIVNDNVVLVQDSILGANSSRRRDVDEYRRARPGAPYEKVLSDIELGDYLQNHLRYKIVRVSDDLQSRYYACNILNLGDGRVIVSAKPVAELLKESNVTTKVVEFDEICAMYGSLHCSSQVLRREKRSSSSTIATSNPQRIAKNVASVFTTPS